MSNYRLKENNINGINIPSNSLICTVEGLKVRLRLLGEPTPFIEANLEEFETSEGVKFSSIAELIGFFNSNFNTSLINTYSNTTVEALMELTPSIADETTAGTTYLGYSTGTSTAAATWAIVKVVESGGLTYFYVVQGGMYFNQIWDNRAALTYVLKTV